MDGRIVELDAQSLEPVGEPFPGEVQVDGVMGLSDDAKRLMVADGLLRTTMLVYDVATRTLLGDPIVLDSGTELGWAAIRSDGLEVAVDSNEGIVVWDLDPAHWVEADLPVRRPQPHPRRVGRVRRRSRGIPKHLSGVPGRPEGATLVEVG